MSALLLALLAPQSLEDVERSRYAALEDVRRARPAAEKDVDAWDAKLLDAQWEYGHALLRLAEFRRQPETWNRVIRWGTDFIWERDDQWASLEARLVLARAHEALQQWGPAFANLKAARPDGKTPELLDLATRSLILEARARLAHGRDHELSLQAARAQLARVPAGAGPVLRLRLETARLLHAVHRDPESRRELESLLTTEVADDALGLLAGLFSLRVAEHAERLFETHDFLRAAVQFRRLPRTPRTWLRLGQCYRQARRFHEAVEALGQAVAVDSPHRLDAALELEKALRAIDSPALPGHRTWMIRTFGEKSGPELLRRQADALLREQRYRDAAAIYARLPGDPEALASRGYCHFRLKEYEAALGCFREGRRSDAVLDFMSWCLVRLERPAELLAHVDAHPIADPVKAQWRLAHRVDALARLARFEEAQATLQDMKEDVALDATVRALERLAAGYEAKNDAALWGAYARTVIALSEKSFKPLKGDKLLAAADALHLEGKPDGQGLAFELYSQYLAAASLRPEEERPIQYRRAVAAAGSGKTDVALNLAETLALAEPFNGSYAELRGDLLAAKADGLPRSPERRTFLEKAVGIYGELAVGLGRRQQDENWYRLTWKYAARLAELDPDRARGFFRAMDARGHAAWDENRWGYRAKMDAVRRVLTK